MSGQSAMGAAGALAGFVGAVANYVHTKQSVIPTLMQVGRAAAEDERQKGRQVGAAQATGYAKANVRLDKGSPVQVMAQSAGNAEMNALRTLFGYKAEAHQREVAAGLSILMLGANAAGQMSNMRLGRRQVAPTTGYGGSSLYARNNAAVNTIPTPYSTDYGSIA